MSLRTSLLALALALTGCHHTFATFSPTSSRNYPARDQGCELEAFMSQPARAYEEIGVFDVANRFHAVDTLDKLRALVGNDACRVGADAIIASASGSGRYVKAVAIRWTAPTAPSAAITTP